MESLGHDDGAMPRIADTVEDQCAACASHLSPATAARRTRQGKQRQRNRFQRCCTRERRRRQLMKPRSEVGNLARFGNTAPRS